MNVWLHLKSVIVSKLAELKIPTHDESTENAMKAQVLQIANRDAPVRALLCKSALHNHFRSLFSNNSFFFLFLFHREEIISIFKTIIA